MNEFLDNLDWDRGDDEYVIAKAQKDPGVWIGALTYFLDTTEADRRNGMYPWNAWIVEVGANDCYDAEDAFMEISDGNIIEELGGYDNRADAIDALVDRFGFDWDIWQRRFD